MEESTDFWMWETDVESKVLLYPLSSIVTGYQTFSMTFCCDKLGCQYVCNGYTILDTDKGYGQQSYVSLEMLNQGTL